jgi:hypothetical protein
MLQIGAGVRSEWVNPARAALAEGPAPLPVAGPVRDTGCPSAAAVQSVCSVPFGAGASRYTISRA